MSLKNIVELTPTLNKLKDFSSLSDVVNSLGASGRQHIATIQHSLKGLSAKEAVEKLNKLSINKDLAKDILTSKKTLDILSSSADEVNEALSGLTASGVTGFDQLKGGFQTTLFLVKSFAPAIAAVGTGIAAIAAFKWADEKFTLTYGTAQKHLAESSTSYRQTVQEVESLNSQLSQVQIRIADLQAQPSLSFADQTELTALQRQEISLQNQLSLKQKIASIQMHQAASDAKTALNWNTEKSEKEFTSVSGGHGDISTTISVPQNITKGEKLEEQIAEYNALQNSINDLDTSKNTADLAAYNSQLQTVSESIAELYSTYEADASNFYDQSTGKVIKGFEKEAAEYERIMAEVSTLGQSDSTKNNALLDSFFNGSSIQGSLMKDYLIDLARTGELTADSFQNIGIDAESLGISDIDTAIEYFNSLADSASHAAKETAKIDGSFSGVASAFQSENAGDKYLSVNDYVQKAKKLYDQGLTGTDDFKAVAELLSPKKDSSKENFLANFKRASRYLTPDSQDGVMNLMQDLSSKGMATWNDSTQKWSLGFENTAEAANALNTSVEVSN